MVLMLCECFLDMLCGCRLVVRGVVGLVMIWGWELGSGKDVELMCVLRLRFFRFLIGVGWFGFGNGVFVMFLDVLGFDGLVLCFLGELFWEVGWILMFGVFVMWFFFVCLDLLFLVVIVCVLVGIFLFWVWGVVVIGLVMFLIIGCGFFVCVIVRGFV